MLKRLLQFFGLASESSTTDHISDHTETPTPVMVVEPVVELEPSLVVAEKPKASRGRKPRATSGQSSKKAPRKRKPKSE